jgi:RHH-type proline utilization regulon transcriptional repressor/proline dehydrogenase/delta 1-pyrroline-5-carboxylate dehydrogenase
VVTGKLTASVDDRNLGNALTRLIARAGEPIIRRGVDLAMRMMGEQFVTGRTIEEALERARTGGERLPLQLRHAGRGRDDGGRRGALPGRLRERDPRHRPGIGRARHREGPGISIKLSALHPRYARAQADRVMAELLPRVKACANSPSGSTSASTSTPRKPTGSNSRSTCWKAWRSIPILPAGTAWASWCRAMASAARM